ncbi:MAG: hypothetical protein HY996_02145, partial [Micrococcales bacterium]|nr:hypothetical protein [Micrococcales bacterium]
LVDTEDGGAQDGTDGTEDGGAPNATVDTDDGGAPDGTDGTDDGDAGPDDDHRPSPTAPDPGTPAGADRLAEPDGAAGSGEAGVPAEDGLLSRLALIADQPLSERADALAQLHDELRSRLEAGDHPRASA